MKDRWCVRCGRTTPTPYTLKVIKWRTKAGLPIRSVLDLGCGNGRNLRAFQVGTDARKLVGFDMCCEQAKRNTVKKCERCAEPVFKTGTLGDTEPPKGKFDVVLLNYSLMFLDFASRERLAKQVAKRVARNGWVVVEMYPAKDSDCKTEAECVLAMWNFVFDTDLVRTGRHYVGVVRRSNLRMIVQKDFVPVKQKKGQ
jgi:SAM-dependent methyltransferase